MNDMKRDEIKARIEEAHARDEARNQLTLVERVEDHALEAKDKFVAFAKEHPVATVAGGLVIGVAIAAMFKRPRRAAVAGGARAASLAAIGSEIALAFASQLLDGAQDAGRSGVRKAGDLGEALGDKAGNLKREAAHLAENARHAAQDAGRSARKSISRRLNRS